MFQHKKAVFHNYSRTADKIMLNRDPYELKRLGNQITIKQDWRDSEEVMYDILRCKFSQNPNLAESLTNTGLLHLHEASADRKWSTGAWPGSDRMGFLLEKLRAEIQGIPFPDPADLPPDTTPPPHLKGMTYFPCPTMIKTILSKTHPPPHSLYLNHPQAALPLPPPPPPINTRP